MLTAPDWWLPCPSLTGNDFQDLFFHLPRVWEEADRAPSCPCLEISQLPPCSFIYPTRVHGVMFSWSICCPDSLPPRVQYLLLPINSTNIVLQEKNRWKCVSVTYIPLEFYELFLYTLIPKLLFPTCHKTCGHMITCNKQLVYFSLFSVVPLTI